MSADRGKRLGVNESANNSVPTTSPDHEKVLANLAQILSARPHCPSADIATPAARPRVKSRLEHDACAQPRRYWAMVQVRMTVRYASVRCRGGTDVRRQRVRPAGRRYKEDPCATRK